MSLLLEGSRWQKALESHQPEYAFQLCHFLAVKLCTNNQRCASYIKWECLYDFSLRVSRGIKWNNRRRYLLQCQSFNKRSIGGYYYFLLLALYHSQPTKRCLFFKETKWPKWLRCHPHKPHGLTPESWRDAKENWIKWGSFCAQPLKRDLGVEGCSCFLGWALKGRMGHLLAAASKFYPQSLVQDHGSLCQRWRGNWN